MGENIARTFIQTFEFSKNWDSLGLNDEDLRKLENEILEDPKAAPVIPGTGGLRKIRFPYQKKGKRGGLRVCYVDFIVYETVYLITVYSKNAKDNLSDVECKRIALAINFLENSLKGEQNE